MFTNHVGGGRSLIKCSFPGHPPDPVIQSGDPGGRGGRESRLHFQQAPELIVMPLNSEDPWKDSVPHPAPDSTSHC